MEYNISYRQKDKGWQYIISYKINGKWKQKAKQGFKTKKEAKPAAEKALRELKTVLNNSQGELNLSYDITFSELCDLFISHEILYKENSTVKGYKVAISKFKDLNNIKVKSIKKIHIQKCIDSLVGENLKVSTLLTYLQRLKVILKYYKNNYDSTYNCDFNLSLPKNIIKTDKKALTNNELNSLLLNLKDSQFYITALIAGTCGLRSSEILGLTWNDIDFKNSILTVNKQWKVNKTSKKSEFGVLKSKNSYRVVPIPDNTIRELKKYKQKNITDIHNRVAPFSKSLIEKSLNPKLRELAGISIHELRHTYATRLIYNGIDFKTAAKILGHDVEQTLKTYSHVTDEMMKNATNIIKQLL